MELKDYLTVAVALIAIFSAIAGGIRWMVKHYLNELKAKRWQFNEGFYGSYGKTH
jgi:hypothetical protein